MLQYIYVIYSKICVCFYGNIIFLSGFLFDELLLLKALLKTQYQAPFHKLSSSADFAVVFRQPQQ